MILIEQVLHDLTVQTIQGHGNTDKALFRSTIQSQQSTVNPIRFAHVTRGETDNRPQRYPNLACTLFLNRTPAEPATSATAWRFSGHSPGCTEVGYGHKPQ